MPPPAPVDPLHPVIAGSDMATKPPAIDLNHAIQSGGGGAGKQATAKSAVLNANESRS
jgi:hypothetical protein